MMNSYRLSILLFIALLISSFAVIYSSHSARKSFIALQDLLKQTQAYDVEWGQLLIEKSTSATYARLESEATGKLKMVAPSIKQIVVVQGKSQ